MVAIPSSARHRVPVVAHLLLFAAGRVLLLRRAGTGRADGFWAPPGGHLEAGELPSRTAVRECEEEVGLQLDPALLRPVATLFFTEAEPHPAEPHPAEPIPLTLATKVGVNVLFAVQLAAPTPPRLLHPDSGADACEWWPIDALPEPRLPWLDDALLRAGRSMAGDPDALESVRTGDDIAASRWYGEAAPTPTPSPTPSPSPSPSPSPTPTAAGTEESRRG